MDAILVCSLTIDYSTLDCFCLGDRVTLKVIIGGWGGGTNKFLCLMDFAGTIRLYWADEAQ